MKISNLKIYKSDSTLIRNIDFNLNGLSFIFGDIEKPTDDKESTNKLGKTLLLRFIDYLYGANEDKRAVKEKIQGYRIVGTIIHGNDTFIVERVLGKSTFTINGDSTIGVEEYKQKFNISRDLIRKQILLDSRKDIIAEQSYNATANEIETSLELLDLKDILVLFTEIKNLKKEIEKSNDSKNQLIKLLEVNKKAVDNEIFKNQKEIQRLNQELEKVNLKLPTLSLSEDKELYQRKYNQISFETKDYNSKKFSLISEKKSLKEFLRELDDSTINEEMIRKIYDQSKFELKDYILRELKEVEEFYKSIIKDRRKFMEQRVKKIDTELDELEKSIDSNKSEMDSISKMLSDNDAYKSAILMTSTLNHQLQSHKVKEGRFEHINKLKEEIAIKESKVSELNGEISKHRLKQEQVITKFARFMYEAVARLYKNDVTSQFEIKSHDNPLKRNPISINFEIQGSTSGGVDQVQNALIDYLFFVNNKKYEILVQDSKCFDGIDYRQVEGLIKILTDILKTINKQAIISINKYQVTDEEMINYIKENSAIILSETDKLLKFDF